MSYAYPSPATQKTNGVVERGNERIEGMSYRQWLMGKILEGSAGDLAEMDEVTFEKLTLRCLELADRFQGLS